MDRVPSIKALAQPTFDEDLERGTMEYWNVQVAAQISFPPISNTVGTAFTLDVAADPAKMHKVDLQNAAASAPALSASGWSLTSLTPPASDEEENADDPLN